MCGICGRVSFDGSEVCRDLITQMCRTLVHRGPDDEGVYTAPFVGLGQRRLSIIDLSPDAVAPLSNEDGSIWVTYNGEIYNFLELRAELVARGHTFRTKTDTEVIVHLYEELGVGCLGRLRGMFALAIWDARQQRLLAARDRLGEKPFFYSRTSRSFTFASELTAILVDPDISVTPNVRALDDYLTYQYVPSPQTAFEGIFKLPAAHFVTCTADGQTHVERYWAPPRPGMQKSHAPAAELETELLDRLEDAVRARLVSDVPLGAFLSGGVDSSLVVALMARISDRPVKTYSIGFGEEEFNELPYARQVAARFETEHHEYIVRPDAADVLPGLVRHYGEPFADSSALPTYYLAKMTRQHVTVALSGDGGDESFGGYENYRKVNAWAAVDVLPAFARRALAAGASQALRWLPSRNAADRGRRAAAMLAADVPGRFRLQSSVVKPEEKQAAYTAEFRGALAGCAAAPNGPASLSWDPGMPALEWMMWHDQQFYLPDCLMVKVDVASMANSLEVRCPFLDHSLVEFAATIPSRLKCDASQGKLILKHAAHALIPPEVISRPKRGFGVPLSRWFDHKLADLLRATLLDDRAVGRKLFAPEFTKRLVTEQIEGRRDWSHRLWALVCLELWFREFID